MVIYMFRKFINEYLEISKQKENKQDYYKASLISLIFSSICNISLSILIILIFTLNFNIGYSILLIVTILYSYVIAPIIILISLLFLILQLRITFNKFSIISTISLGLLIGLTITSIIVI